MPAIIHRYWAGSAPASDWAGSVLARVHPDLPVRTTTPYNAPEDLADLLAQQPSDPRHQANIARCWLLHRFGGLWVDHDVIPLARLDTSPDPWTASIHERREGCAMWFPEPGHPMLAGALHLLEGPHIDQPPLLAQVLSQLAPACTDGVRKEPRVIPYAANGRPLLHPDQQPPLAIHLWATSRRSHT